MPVKKKRKKADIKKLIPQRPDRESYEKIVGGYKFKVVNVGTVKDYPDEAFWCDFCGGRGKNYVTIRRSDGNHYKVGERCLGRVGLVIPVSAEEDVSLVKVEAVKPKKGKSPVKPTHDPLQDEIEKLLKDL